MTIAEFKLAALAIYDFADWEVEKILLNLEVSSEIEVVEIVEILEKYRPTLAQKLANSLAWIIQTA